MSPYRLDVRMEVDDFDLEDLAHAINHAKVERNVEVSAVVMREAQYLHVKREASHGPWAPGRSMGIAAIFGVTIICEGDGLTPRERSVQRMLRDEFRPTRDEQVAEILAEQEETLAALRAQAAHNRAAEAVIPPHGF